MRLRNRVMMLVLGAVAALAVMSPASVNAQVLERIPNIYPMNGLADPYESEDNWVRLPGNRTWGSTAGVDIAPDGRTIWAIDRCGANSCAGSDLDPILEIDQDGNVRRAIGAGTLPLPARDPRGPGRQHLGDGRSGSQSAEPRDRREGPRGHQAQP